MSEQKHEAKLLTVADLIRRLKTVDRTAVVAIKCGDSYYSGPAEVETFDGELAFIRPHDYLTHGEDNHGRPISRATRRYDGGWWLADDDDKHPQEEYRVPAFVLMTGE